MIARLIAWSFHHPAWVAIAAFMVATAGLWSFQNTPLDAIPDLSEQQVVLVSDWPGRSPQVVEDQLTYPLTRGLQGLPGVRAVRAQSALGLSMVNLVFEDGVDPYWARSRVSERLATLQNQLPPGVAPQLGPDGTGVGHVFWYVLRSDSLDLGRLRAVQDFYLKPGLQSVPGVAEVASAGGFQQELQVDLWPHKLRAFGLDTEDVAKALRESSGEGSGGLVEWNGAEHSIRALGYVKEPQALRDLPLKLGSDGRAVRLGQVAEVRWGPGERRGLLDWNGQGEVVGGIVVMRQGAHAQRVIDAVKAKLEQLKQGLPPGVRVEVAYDRSDLMDRAVGTLKRALVEEALVVALVLWLFLRHGPSALVVVLSIPVAVLFAFVGMRALGFSSNLMSLGGIAIAIGVLVDAGIVMVENAHRRLAEAQAEGPLDENRRQAIVLASAQAVGRPIFFSLLLLVVGFLPVFLLSGQEGKLFHPLAATKSLAMLGAALLSVSLLPPLLSFCLRGRIRPESDQALSRWALKAYAPLLGLALRWRKATLALAALALLCAWPLAKGVGSEFMPALREGSLLFMPVSVPALSITEAKRLVQQQDRIIASLPEVASVLGKVGRADTATDPAPISMFESIILLKDPAQWRPGMTQSQLVAELDAALRIPGVGNGWTQPIINRINMLSTGVRTELGLKILGPDLKTLEGLARQAEAILRRVPGSANVVAERLQGGRFVDLIPKREVLLRQGLSVVALQRLIETALAGTQVNQVIDGRARYPMRLRYAASERQSLPKLLQSQVRTPLGATLPLSELVEVRLSEGPPMIASEDAQLRSLVFLNVQGRDLGGFVAEAQGAIARDLKLPPGYSLAWSGQYEGQLRAQARLRLVVPLVLLLSFALLRVTFQRSADALLIMMALPFAMVGGVALQWLTHTPFSVAVWVGHLALVGLAAETGVVMLLYLNEALDAKLAEGPLDAEGLRQAVWEGAALRLRPKLMTVAAALGGLLPLLWSQGTGSELMRPLAIPMVGGLISSSAMVLLVLPVLFMAQKHRALSRGRLQASGLKH